MNISQEVLNNNYINVRTLTLKEKEIPFAAFLLACEKGYLNIVQYFVSGKYGEIQDNIETIKNGIDFGIMTAKENNHNDVIKFLSNYDFNNPSFINLCTYQELFDYYVEKNSIKLSHIINDILAYKRFDLYKQFIIKDAQYKDVLIRDINIK